MSYEVPAEIKVTQTVYCAPVEDITKFKTESGWAVALVSGDWATIFSKTTAKLTRMKCIKITITGGPPTGLLYRIRGCETGGTKQKLFPYGDSKSLKSGEEYVFEEKVSVPKGWDYQVEVYCVTAAGASATLTSLKVIEVGA